MKKLCLFTNEFPYGTREPYLETEVKYYREFDKIYIFSLQLRKEHKNSVRNLGINAEIFPVDYAPKLIYFLYSFVALTDKNLYIEIRHLINQKRFSFKRLMKLFIFISRSHYESNMILKNFTKEDLDNSIMYSYRFEYQSYVAYLIRKKLNLNSQIISRAHRFDLYEEERDVNYIPMRKTLLSLNEKVFPCSEDGTNYLKHKFPEYSSKIETRFLGTSDFGLQTYTTSRSLRLVSCSNVVPVKRVDLIVNALDKIRDIPIEWTHYGDGIEMSNLKNLVSNLGDNITVNLKGRVPNSVIMEEYKDSCYDWFLNVSTSEGIPVSIMEAMSFGIPCLGTDVGGTSEIINSKNGILFNKGLTPLDLADNLRKVYEFKEIDYVQFRDEARRSRERKYNAEMNYDRMAKYLLKRCDTI